MRENELLMLYEPYIIKNWKEKGVSLELLEKINFFFPELSEKNSDICLLHICSLLELKRYEEAESILAFYLKKFGTAKIERSLPVAGFASSLCIHTEYIDKAAHLFEIFEKNKDWYKFLIGKRVAVVGNGPEELGKRKGKEIDAHDIVIRFNNIYAQSAYANDYGTKTDIWVKNVETRYQIFNEPSYLEYNKRILCDLIKFDYWHNFVNDFDYFSLCMKFSPHSAAFYTVEDINRCKRYSKIPTHVPSVGFPILLYLYEKLDFLEHIDFYGFSFLNEDVHFSGHFLEQYDDAFKSKIEGDHNMYEEALVLKKLFGRNVHQGDGGYDC